MNTFEFGGYATKNNIKCADGRTIRKDAFKHQDGVTVPLVYAHSHDDAFNVLGHAILENRDDGVYARCSINLDTTQGRNAKSLIEHGDINALSIYANGLTEKNHEVFHGNIRELSLVLSGANPGAYIDVKSFAHDSDDSEFEAVIYSDEVIAHSSDNEGKEKTGSDIKVEDVLDSMTDEQRAAVYMLLKDVTDNINQNKIKDDDNKEGDDSTMKHNVFADDVKDTSTENVLSHSDIEAIFKDAKRIGSLRDAVDQYTDGGTIMHSIPTDGMVTPTGEQTYGFNDASMLFPDARTIANTPEWIKRKTDWVVNVLNGVHRNPFSRIKSLYADITEDDARAFGYLKGHQKKEEVFTTLKRVTTPQTIYKKQKLDRDDIVDITDFDIVTWIRAEMREMLNEEIARAILIGDGRNVASDDHIKEDCVRPIAKDVALFNTTYTLSQISAYGSAQFYDGTDGLPIRNSGLIEDGVLTVMSNNYRGSGNTTFFINPAYYARLMTSRDENGRRIYDNDETLAKAMGVKRIVPVDLLNTATIEVAENDDRVVVGIIVDLSDYVVGADKGGSVNLFDDFDIDYNQYKYLIETRISGALVKPYSAITIIENAD